jgi:hypothetical protein
MAKEDTLILPVEPTDVSGQALAIAHLIDRLCQRPGEYQITISVPYHQRPWIIDFCRVDHLRSIKLPG